MKKLFLLLSAIFTLSACGTLEVSIYQTPTAELTSAAPPAAPDFNDVTALMA